jgi:hypothetical protein
MSMMRSIFGACIALNLCCAVAQEDHDPQVILVHPGITALNTDLMSLTNLSSEEEKAYGADLEAFIQDFALGIDGEKAVVVHAITSSTPVSYLIWMPYEDRFDFLDNLESIGFPAFVQPESDAFYLIDDGIDKGWLRLLTESEYAVLALVPAKEDEELYNKLTEQVKQQVLATKLPGDALQLLGEPQASIVMHLQNEKLTPDDQAGRRQTFSALREQDMEVIVKRPDEAESEFEFRKGSASFFYDEMERIYAEAANVDLRAALDRETSSIEIHFEAAGITESSLGGSLAMFGKSPDAFTAIQPLAENVLSGRLNHPIDEMRKKNANAYIDLLTTDVHRRIDVSETLNDAEKAATQILYDDVAKVFRDGFESGNVNGFVEAVHDGRMFTMVGAVSTPGSASLADTLQQVPLSRSGNEVEMSVATEGNITIHRLRLAEGFVKFADDFFGAGADYLVGLGNDQVWLATGPAALEILQSKIKEVGDPESNNNVLSVDFQLGPWVQRLQELAEEREQPEAVEDRAAWRESLVRLKQLAESLTSDDELSLSVASDGATVNASLQIHKGVLTFLGRQIAKMTKENLDL